MWILIELLTTANSLLELLLLWLADISALVVVAFALALNIEVNCCCCCCCLRIRNIVLDGNDI